MLVPLYNLIRNHARTISSKTWKGPGKWRIFRQCKCGNVGSALQLDSKPRSNNLFKDLERTLDIESSAHFGVFLCPLRTMAECGPRKRKYRRFQVGAFMAVHKQKREEAVKAV